MRHESNQKRSTRFTMPVNGNSDAGTAAHEDILNSWKEIAVYLGRGVRTVQRWEQELALPVRRPRGRSRSAVLAFKRELDKWLARTPNELSASDALPYRSIVRTAQRNQALARETVKLLIDLSRLTHAITENLAAIMRDQWTCPPEIEQRRSESLLAAKCSLHDTSAASQIHCLRRQDTRPKIIPKATEQKSA
jgi:hypothetical protein